MSIKVDSTKKTTADFRRLLQLMTNVIINQQEERNVKTADSKATQKLGF
jgi:uncharacterized protein (UPF0147 family)